MTTTNRNLSDNFTGSWEACSRMLADYAASLAGPGADQETLRAAMRRARRDYPRLAARVDGKFPADAASVAKVNTTVRPDGRSIMSNGVKIWNSDGEILAERPSPMTRREALDRLCEYAIGELRLHPSLYFAGGADAAMRLALEQARRDLPDIARAAH